MLTAEGFIKKTYDEYLEELEQQARELFGENANLSEHGPLGKFIRLQAYGRAEENELSEAVYLSGSVDNAEGIALDYVVKLAGMARLQATKATAVVELTVNPFDDMQPGLIVSTSDGVEFITTTYFEDEDGDGIITATVEALDAGLAGNVPANTITVIETPVAGLTAVNNPSEATGGRDKETDKELRDRHADIGATGLSSSVNGIRATVLNDVPDVQSVIIIENASNETDSGGRPAKSFETIVFGGSSEEIATAILKAKPAGIKAHGTTTVVVKDDSGQDQTIGFSLATQVAVMIYCEMTINSSFPANGMDLITTEIIKYIGGTDADGTKYPGLGMGKSVIHSKLASIIINNVPGIDDIYDLEIGKVGGSLAIGNLSIEAKEVAQISFNDVDVVI